jgi:prepilin-type N-terminal cleavage/methylation domain-containing protein
MKYRRGFTLIEVLMATALAVLLLAMVATFFVKTNTLNRNISQGLGADLLSRQVLRTMQRELRSAKALSATTSESITLLPEQIRYYLDPELGALMRGTDSETKSLIIGLGSTTPLFEYNGNFIKIRMIINGREYSSGATLRNP